MKLILTVLYGFIYFILSITTVNAQFFEKMNYPRQYFQWPVGAKIALVANFGELRPNHYHMGLDCRTDQVVNKPVYAAANGYIAKIKIEPFGFGRAIYINHPNGLTSLYAHLNDFYPELEKYVKEQQYKQKQWNVFLEIPANLFPVKKGAFIAYSGNTGGSQGPHVHFEIRDTKTDKVLNPLLMGFPIQDNIPPNIIRLAIYDRNKSTYEQAPKIVTLKKVNGEYVPASGKLKVNTTKVSFAITAYDRYTGSTNQNGIYEAVLFDNGNAIAGFQMDSISYLETRYLNAHIDYKYRAGGGPFLQHLSRLPGNHGTIYKTDESNGIINFEQENEHQIIIAVSDPNGNTSILRFNIVMDKSISIQTPAASGNLIQFTPGYINVFENDKIKFYLDENAIYDSFKFRYAETKNINGNPIFQLHNATIPLQTYYTVNISKNIINADTGKVVMHRFYGGKNDYKKATYQNGWYNASFREFGNFQLMADNIPPEIRSIGYLNGLNTSKLSRLIFVVTDNTEEIKNFTALLDGKWLRLSNDKGKTFIYQFDEMCPPGYHELVITAEDQVGNISTKTFNFTR